MSSLLIKNLRDMAELEVDDHSLCAEAADRIEELEGILHRVAEQERKLSRAASDAHAASRAVNDGFICGPFVELSDWYTFEEDD